MTDSLLEDRPEDRLHTLLRVACEDALFAIAGRDPASFAALAERRTVTHEHVARQGLAHSVVMPDPGVGARPEEPGISERDKRDEWGEWDAWLQALVRDAAPAFAPWFVPMHHAISDGVTLHREPRGLRAVIPIGLEASQARLRRDGMLAVRVARAVAAADSALSPDEVSALDLLLTALGLADADVRLLRAEAPIPVAALDLEEDRDAKTARMIVAGAWQVAACDGLDDREEAAVVFIAERLGLESQVLDDVRVRVLGELAAQRRVGRALIDVARYVLAASPADEARALVRAAVHLAIPPLDRGDLLRAVESDATTPLAEPHTLDRAERDRVLAGAWAMALRFDPTHSARAGLRARHDRAAAHLDAARRADDARKLVEDVLDDILARGAAAVGV